MDAFSSSPLMESFPASRFGSPLPSPTQTEIDLPDVDQSFNSSLTISAGDSPLPSPLAMSMKTQPSPLAKHDTFLSPTPGIKMRRPDPVPLQRGSTSRSSVCSLGSVTEADEPPVLGVPRPARAFGREMSLNARPLLQPTKSKGMMLPPAVPESRMLGRPPRGGVPMQWTSSNEEMQSPRMMAPGMTRRESEPPSSSASPRNGPMRSHDLMDVDSPHLSGSRVLFSQSPSTFAASSLSGSPGLGSFFENSPSAQAAAVSNKRRSLVATSPASPSSSPSAKRTSLGQYRQLEKASTSGALLFGAPRANTIASRRNGVVNKRPQLLPVPTAAGRSTTTNSAYPILYAPPTAVDGTFGLQQQRPGPKSMRRAYSVCDQPAHDVSDDEGECDASPSVVAQGMHAAYARRYGNRHVARPDGSPGFKPVRSSIAVSGQGEASASPVRGKKTSPFGPGGLPGFGDNETEGKILPCHTVKEDGLVRITPETLDDVLAGKYDGKMRRFHVLDCRFDYEYNGGHVQGAINVKNEKHLDELLLRASTGVHADVHMPVPSRSGASDQHEQVVLIFHCEFSLKRAPTFAKHLRSRDRQLNGAIYPKIYFPELYILEGGYSSFYKTCAPRCEPQAYVPMDDPRHFQRRDSDLHDFRKFSRTRSFTYGETQPPPPPPRLAPPCPPLAFAAASAAQGRRHADAADTPLAPGITIEEEGEDGSSPLALGRRRDVDVDASPCERALSMGAAAPIFGSAKTRTLGRVGFHRVASYAGPQRP
ncbi:m-phase inducer phosphatase [Cryptotrichosporon argae]